MDIYPLHVVARLSSGIRYSTVVPDTNARVSRDGAGRNGTKTKETPAPRPCRRELVFLIDTSPPGPRGGSVANETSRNDSGNHLETTPPLLGGTAGSNAETKYSLNGDHNDELHQPEARPSSRTQTRLSTNYHTVSSSSLARYRAAAPVSTWPRKAHGRCKPPPFWEVPPTVPRG